MALGDLVVEDLTDVSVDTASALISELGKIGNWLQALGIIVILWIIMQIINFIFNKKKKERLESIEKSLKRIESKISKLQKSKN